VNLYLDNGRRRYWPRNTEYSENPDSRTDLDLLQLLPPKRFFSENFVNKKVVDNFITFPESTRTQASEFVWERYGQNTELDRDNSETR
jgi:hypothetical protein